MRTFPLQDDPERGADMHGVRIAMGVVAALLLAGGLTGCGGSNDVAAEAGSDCKASITPWLEYAAYEVNGAMRSAETAEATADAVVEGQNPYEIVTTLFAGSLLDTADGLERWASTNADCPGASEARTLAGAMKATVASDFADATARDSLWRLGNELRVAAGVTGGTEFFDDGGPVPAEVVEPPSS
jgi:hypothetical protein